MSLNLVAKKYYSNSTDQMVSFLVLYLQ